MNTIDIGVLAQYLKGKFEKDEYRMGLFIAVSQKKAIEYVTLGDKQNLQVFSQESAILIGSWVHKATHLSFMDAFRDPFKILRAETRTFAKKWDLDKAFIDAMEA